ncbi:MAG: FHIPEP family type III secretion protein [Candidatus Eremiobacteraeota bacterium]|nr:FHIPEP family type III secretion protein [Candidatus Eremiobacteraeota bacterium]
MKSSSTIFGGIMLSIVLILILPVPPWLLDTLLGANMVGCALALLMSVTVEDPLEFSAFAPALLVATLFRLSLDVSATRLILTQGEISGAVGAIIPAFGAFVVRGNLVVGLIVFAILITIQFIVIAQGSQRVAEVAARFTLDAMPGKQMAIDADVHAGLLDSDAARRGRALVQKEADFYGAMDGAGKFVKGDAVASLVIVGLNLLGGITVGVVYHHMAPLDAIDTYALLSIGNALVTTLPAFLMSIAMGMMVTRVATEGSLGSDIAVQLFSRPDVLAGGSALCFVLAFVPALPAPLFVFLGICATCASANARKRQRDAAAAERANADAHRRTAIRRPEMALGLVGVDAVCIEVGSDLLALLAPPLAEQLLDRIGEVRRALAGEIGIVLPGVRLRDDVTRDPDSYAIRIRDALAGTGTLELARVLAVAGEQVLEIFAGAPVREPVYGLPARWIASAEVSRAVEAGALVFDPISIIGSHLAEAARTHAAALLGRQELQTLIEHLRAVAPAVVKEVGTEALPLPLLHRAFTLLLRERAWPRDPAAAIEAIVDAAAHTRDPRDLAEAARRSIVPALLRRRGRLVLTPLLLAPELDAGFPEAAPDLLARFRARVERYRLEAPRRGAALICTAATRPLAADLLLRWGIALDVFSYAELPSEVELQAVDVFTADPVPVV